MRHGDKINNLGRTASHRKALLKNLASELITHKRINTTLAKAKALRTFIEPLITKAKDNTTSPTSRSVQLPAEQRKLLPNCSDLSLRKLVVVLVDYTRIIKLGIRVGDNAETSYD